MDKVLLSKDRSTTLEIDANKFNSSRFDTMTNRSPSDLVYVKSTKHSDYNSSPNK